MPKCPKSHPSTQFASEYSDGTRLVILRWYLLVYTRIELACEYSGGTRLKPDLNRILHITSHCSPANNEQSISLNGCICICVFDKKCTKIPSVQFNIDILHRSSLLIAPLTSILTGVDQVQVAPYK